MDKKSAAEVLYREGYNQTDISKILDVSNNTLSKWARSANWREKKISDDLLQDSSVQRILKLIDYQTKALERRIQSWIDEDTQSTKLIERGDIDALQKLFTTIRQDAKKFTHYIQVTQELMQFIQHIDLELAQRLTEPADRFLNEKRKLF
ncbi:MAG TPA: hypothetical protein PK047_06890 [Saprospiraceae bacterium]|nr:hypothetical protein [Saprospiraceae bacterium]HRP41963.1 hypothetical protein [Saprospiraceae bacterium]